MATIRLNPFNQVISFGQTEISNISMRLSTVLIPSIRSYRLDTSMVCIPSLPALCLNPFNQVISFGQSWC